jgi:LysR family glycine cleavage system transcriptional activator
MNELPSLNGLRAFEAAARCGSVKQAAAELFVTPGAVSQQIKGLEEALGTPLFRRAGTGLRLTEAGAALYPVLHESFGQIAAALQRVRAREQAGPLTVSVMPSFAAKWLVPRLGRFRARHPQIDVRIGADARVVDLAHEDVELAIRYGQGNNPGLHSEKLLGEILFPVCSPRLLEGPQPLRTPADLRHTTLLHDDTTDEWQAWLTAHGVQGVDASRGPVFNDASMTLQAAIDEQGVALGRDVLVAEDLARGRLVRPFEGALPFRSATYLVCLPAVAEWPKVAAFMAWIREEARAYQAARDAEQQAASKAFAEARPRARRKRS